MHQSVFGFSHRNGSTFNTGPYQMCYFSSDPCFSPYIYSPHVSNLLGMSRDQKFRFPLCRNFRYFLWGLLRTNTISLKSINYSILTQEYSQFLITWLDRQISNVRTIDIVYMYYSIKYSLVNGYILYSYLQFKRIFCFECQTQP